MNFLFHFILSRRNKNTKKKMNKEQQNIKPSISTDVLEQHNYEHWMRLASLSQSFFCGNKDNENELSCYDGVERLAEG